MKKFKKGDKFIPRKPKVNKRIIWNNSMDIYDGKVLTIDYITVAGNIKPKEGICLFHPDWCEKVGNSKIPNDHIPDVGKIDWEQRRYELAKEFIGALIIAKEVDARLPINVCNIKCGIEYADEIIKQLKGE